MATVCASQYGGPGDPTSGTHGYKGDNLQGRMAFAELNMGTALGGLPYRYKLKIDYGGRSVIAEKLDIGLGGTGCGGHPRAIDLWYETANALGFSGLAPVTVTGGSEMQQGSTGQRRPVFSLPWESETPSQHKESEQFIPEPKTSLPNPLSALKGFGEFFGKLVQWFPHILGFFKLFFTKDGIIRVGKVVLGIVLILTGVLGMAKIEAAQTVTKGAGKVAEVAAFVPK